MVKPDALYLSVAVVGPSGVGKEVFAGKAATHFYTHGFNTGMAMRAASRLGHKEGIFEDGSEGTYRLRPSARPFIHRLLEHGTNGLHFIGMPLWKEPMAHIMLGTEDLTPKIRPMRNGCPEYRSIEMGAAAIAADPTLRESFLDLWRRTITEVLGGSIVIAKTPEQFMPGARAVVALHTDVETAAAHRMSKNVAAFPDLPSEVEYLKRRDRIHTLNGLDDIPEGALRFDTTAALRNPNGDNMQKIVEHVDRHLGRLAYVRSESVVA